MTATPAKLRSGAWGARVPDLPKITEVRVYLLDGERCYAADDEDGYDHSDTLDTLDTDTLAVAVAEAQRMFPGAEITVV